MVEQINLRKNMEFNNENKLEWLRAILFFIVEGNSVLDKYESTFGGTLDKLE